MEGKKKTRKDTGSSVACLIFDCAVQQNTASTQYREAFLVRIMNKIIITIPVISTQTVTDPVYIISYNPYIVFAFFFTCELNSSKQQQPIFTFNFNTSQIPKFPKIQQIQFQVSLIQDVCCLLFFPCLCNTCVCNDK